MKVLFAVNNDNVVETIVKKYQKDYKEILSYKNVYYFNAILRELQKDKSYSRVVISEDLEPFANNNYDSIDKFLFEKYSNIAEEARSMNNAQIDIILICADRRKRTDNMLAKIYKKDIYNAIIGQDRTVDEVCRLIYNPRDREKSKAYYGIQESELGETESENNVSEAEVENIIAHYARLGKNEDKYLESFNNIVAQYTDTQLKIIIKYLPMHVKAVLEERSPKYQQLVTTGGMNDINVKMKTANYKEQLKNSRQQINETTNNEKEDILQQLIKPRNIKSVVVPTNLQAGGVQKVVVPAVNTPEIDTTSVVERQSNSNIEPNNDESLLTEAMKNINIEDTKEKLLVRDEEEVMGNEPQLIEFNVQEKQHQTETIQENVSSEDEIPQKRGRGRPRKTPVQEEQEEKPKRGRGRPRKNPVQEEQTLSSELQNEKKEQKISEEPEIIELEKTENSNTYKPDEDINLYDLYEQNEQETAEQDEEVDLFNIEEEKAEVDLFNLNETSQQEPELNSFNLIEKVDKPETDLFNIKEDSTNVTETKNTITPIMNNTKNTQESYNAQNTSHSETIGENVANNNYITRINNSNSNFNTLLTSDKKIVAFVGTTKNGTSFIVNNTAEMLSSMGINTAILDMTKSKNAYYIYTDDREELREISKECMENLQKGITKGIEVNKYLTIYTEMPGDKREYEIETVLSTLLGRYSAVLIDTDFDTPITVFEKVQEIYLVQSMDVLTIQPLTAFLRNLKSQNVLRQEKLKIIINKSEKVRSLSIKTLIGGMSCYNAPSMTYMTELFNKDNIKYCEIPFEEQNYVKYLDSLVNCSISLNGYTKQFLVALKELTNMVYPLVNKSSIKDNRGSRTPFSNEVNETLNKMKKRY